MLDKSQLSYGFLLQRAWPLILANASVPLLGLVDTAVIGNTGSTIDLGAIAFGALVFSFVYWSFGFLRMGTTGFVAQAVGADDEPEIRAAFGRALLIAAGVGLLLVLLQWPIAQLAFMLLDGSEEVESVARSYFAIRIWGAPATLSVFVLMGMWVGLGESRQLLGLQLLLNGLNMALDILFAGVFGWGAEGIAAGTLIAEVSTCLLGGLLLLRYLRRRRTAEETALPFWPREKIIDLRALRQTLSANMDIMLRTLMLVFSFAFFTNQSARFGDVNLAANHLLLQLISFAAFFLDGFAYVAESLVGKAYGARRLDYFDLAVRRSSLLAFATALFLAVWIWVLGPMVIAALTDLEPVRVAAGDLLFLAAIYIAFSFPAYQLDGIFIGASRTGAMRNAAFIALAVFLLAWWLLTPRFGIGGLWWAMIIYVAARADALLMFYPGLRKAFSQAPKAAARGPQIRDD